MIKRLSVNTIMEFNPCYTVGELKDLWKKAGLKKTVGIIDFLKCKHEKKNDLIWMVLRPEIIPEKILYELACDFAESALMNEREHGREPHVDSWNAIKIKRLWIEGKVADEELSVAASAARAASAAVSAASAAWAARAEQIQIIIKKLEEVK